MSAIPVADDVLDADVAVLSLSETARVLGLSSSKVRQLLKDGHLIAIRRDGELLIPEEFLSADGKDGIVKGLVGTITVLDDAGFSRTEMLRWLFTSDETLPGSTPINALRTSHGTEVKRRAQAMAF
ncbi:Rv2175c family DNA-binding protein [Amycolatopsis suaedae]|uniref:DNA-binding protein n=1 Tax=Amycolatopsis suaedae TaxID=2510978 RepID=A0A4Q7IZQ0_9PSEU|nr:Rv2175c family DNA-binding protein [Amycolatopsis suaedae]RZQ59989.1 DNA-binding protein [Amycolatopsis suaedae]